jgi:hypothetical protein
VLKWVVKAGNFKIFAETIVLYMHTLVRSEQTVSIETTSNSTLDAESVSDWTPQRCTADLFERLKMVKPVNVNAQLPTLEDVRAVMSQNFIEASEE